MKKVTLAQIKKKIKEDGKWTGWIGPVKGRGRMCTLHNLKDLEHELKAYKGLYSTKQLPKMSYHEAD